MVSTMALFMLSRDFFGEFFQTFFHVTFSIRNITIGHAIDIILKGGVFPGFKCFGWERHRAPGARPSETSKVRRMDFSSERFFPGRFFE